MPNNLSSSNLHFPFIFNRKIVKFKDKWQMTDDKLKIRRGFTLIELLVVITILGILAVIGLETFTSSQARARDAQRKSDLKQMANSLELFYSDYDQYPASDSGNGEIKGCSYNPINKTGGDCSWGTGPFTDGKTTYFQALPKDPASNLKYYYRTALSGQAYLLFAYLENSQDQSIISTTYSCGSSASYKCNFSITSANATPASTPDP
jgi:type II secretion system protein G